MSKHWVREENRHDALAEKTNSFLSWVKTHREYAIGIPVTILAIIILAIFFVYRKNRINDTAWEKLFIAQQTAFAGKTDEAMKNIDEIASNFKNTDAALYGLVFKGDILYRQGKYSDAAQAYAAVSAANCPKYAPFGIAGEISCAQAAGDNATAIEKAGKFLAKYQDNYLAPEVSLNMAYSQEQSGDAAGAKATYEKIAAQYPNTYWAATASAKLNPSSAKAPNTGKKKSADLTQNK